MIAGEEGSNVFCLGDGKFIRGASSLSRLCRDSFSRRENENATAHEQVFTPKIFTLTRFQQHMVDDNYTAQACMRAGPGTVRPEDFKIERVRSPIGPENLVRQYADPAPSKPLERLIDAMASRNKPPRLARVGDATIPLFGDDYDWPEQQRVRAAMDALMRTKSDDLWWRLRASIGDDRYVLTATRGDVAKNFTLGALCCDIVNRGSAWASRRTCLPCPGGCRRVFGRSRSSGSTRPNGPASVRRSTRCRPPCAGVQSSNGRRF